MTRPVTLAAPGTVRLERLLPGPAERVWRYLTESDKRATWLAGGEFDLRVGGRIELEFHHDRLSCEKTTPERFKHTENARFSGKITRLEPHRVLAYTWEWGDKMTEVSFELTPRGKDVLLVIVHRNLGERDVLVNVASGWDVHTGILADVLSGVEPRPFWTTHAQLEKQYAARL
jgi:uncharacterized protein YndB with AHSA1/START domain